MIKPYCPENCNHLVPVMDDKRRVEKYLCTMYISHFERKYGDKVRCVKKYPELERDGSLIIKCPQCLRAEDRIGRQRND